MDRGIVIGCTKFCKHDAARAFVVLRVVRHYGVAKRAGIVAFRSEADIFLSKVLAVQCEAFPRLNERYFHRVKGAFRFTEPLNPALTSSR